MTNINQSINQSINQFTWILLCFYHCNVSISVCENSSGLSGFFFNYHWLTYLFNLNLITSGFMCILHGYMTLAGPSVPGLLKLAEHSRTRRTANWTAIACNLLIFSAREREVSQLLTVSFTTAFTRTKYSKLIKIALNVYVKRRVFTCNKTAR